MSNSETYGILGTLAVAGIVQVFATSILTVRRLNDAGKDRTLAVLLLLPPANVILLVYLLFVPSATALTKGNAP